MKWTVHQLRKLVNSDNTFAYVTDLSNHLGESTPDLFGISPVSVSGMFMVTNQDNEFRFSIDVACELVMACAITLEEVLVPLAFTTELVFARKIDDDDQLPIEGITIDLDPYVFAEILVEKPMRVVKEGAYEGYVETIVTLDDEQPLETNPFAKLKRDQE